MRSKYEVRLAPLQYNNQSSSPCRHGYLIVTGRAHTFPHVDVSALPLGPAETAALAARASLLRQGCRAWGDCGSDGAACALRGRRRAVESSLQWPGTLGCVQLDCWESVYSCGFDVGEFSFFFYLSPVRSSHRRVLRWYSLQAQFIIAVFQQKNNPLFISVQFTF